MDETAELIPDLLAKDLDDGFTELVRVHAGVVFAFLRRVSGSTTDADDLGQETFLRAYTALRGYPPERRRALQARTWLLTIAANVWRNHVRSRVRHPESPLIIEYGAERWPDLAPGPAEKAATADDRRKLVAALATLPEAHRISVVLRHVVGLSYAELAEVQGCPVGTAKAHVSRGVGSLRRLLQGTTLAGPEEVTA
jgi:RNA polymerase sigma-70 factor (ECF subfamily)